MDPIVEEPCPAVGCGLPGYAWVCLPCQERGWPEPEVPGVLHLWHDRAGAEAAYAVHLADPERHP